MMLSKNKIRLIRSLERKKNRDKYGLFLVEGNKLVREALSSEFEISQLICTPTFALENSRIIDNTYETIIADKDDIRKTSLLMHSQEALAIVKIPKEQAKEDIAESELCLALDCIQDPGNMGTILRIADWFGITHIICSEDTVDCFNPKVVQASMGAIFRTKISYTGLKDFVSRKNTENIPVYGTFLNGSDIYTHALSPNGIIVMGNEGAGISPELEKLIGNRLFIPSFSSGKSGSESLNVAVATAICCSEFRRR